MAEPAAVHRARSLLKHVQKLGGQPEDFYVLVTKDEAIELLKWFRTQVDETKLNVALYDRDVRRALKRDDPFEVLEQFTLCGLPIRPASSIH